MLVLKQFSRYIPHDPKKPDVVERHRVKLDGVFYSHEVSSLCRMTFIVPALNIYYRQHFDTPCILPLEYRCCLNIAGLWGDPLPSYAKLP